MGRKAMKSMLVQVCIGSSCHLRGSHEIVELLQSKVEELNLDTDITLAGSFCSGRCNREGVTISVDDETYTGITKETFKEFFSDKILKPLDEERK